MPLLIDKSAAATWNNLTGTITGEHSIQLPITPDLAVGKRAEIEAIYLTVKSAPSGTYPGPTKVNIYESTPAKPAVATTTLVGKPNADGSVGGPGVLGATVAANLIRPIRLWLTAGLIIEFSYDQGGDATAWGPASVAARIIGHAYGEGEEFTPDAAT